jgi:hypothetical protein
MRTTRRTSIVTTLLAAALASLATVLALPGGGAAETAVRPVNTAEPRISGSATVGATLTASQGSWTGSPTSFSYQWVRCPRSGGLPTGADCAAIGGATTTSYVVSTADVDRRLRVRVTASNAGGSTTVASNATAVIDNPETGRPRNVQAPTIAGTPSQGQTLRVQPGTWTGRQPITFTFNWLRCDAGGNNCIVQPGFNDDAYVVREGDVGKTMRTRVNARNSRGEASRLTAQTAVVTGPQGPPGVITLPNGEKSIPVTSVPSDQRLVIDQVTFSPSPVRSRTEPITVRVKVEDTRGFVVRDAMVFFRSTPLVTRNPQDQRTGQDGWLQLTVTPEQDFPELRPAYAVQFFVKAFRQGDPELAGVGGYRLVQVPLGGTSTTS